MAARQMGCAHQRVCTRLDHFGHVLQLLADGCASQARYNELELLALWGDDVIWGMFSDCYTLNLATAGLVELT